MMKAKRGALLAAALASSCLGLNVQTRAKPAMADADATAQKQAAEAESGQKKFGLPIACRLGEDCYIMHYVDVDPSPAEHDFACGRQTYDQHDGTDFAIANEKAMAAGVAVIAAAAGTVSRARDGMADRRVEGEAAKQAVGKVECGNGLVVDHGQGWESQYCHLKQGSVRVKPGEVVAKGAVLGMVGESGLAGFPHVHLTLRHLGKPVDPFVGPAMPPGCGGPRRPVWEAPLAYVPTGLVQAGFATQTPTLGEVLAGTYRETVFPVGSPALIFWVHDFGVLQGDIESFQMTSPGGETVIKQEQALKNAQRAWLSFAGKRNSPEKPLAAGVWQARYRLKRGDEVIVDIHREANLQ